MLDPKTSRFWKAALQSGLLDAEALAACWDAISPEKRDDAEHLDRRLGRQAVYLQRLTLWQAQQLLAGRITGFQVDRYILQELIGQGGMGRVYRAKDTRLDRHVALKILSPERMNNPRAIARFQREAKVGAQLQHENLVRLYDFGESQGRHFLVMEFIEGKTLGFYIATQGRIPPAVAARFCRQVALGLDHAHGKGLIHRDVNPYNVIVTKEGIAKLADMGLAIDLADEGKVTRDGATVGTFDYVAPEQARHSHSADIRSDIYSLGCTFYHMVAGQVPFPHPGLAEKLFAHQSQEAAPLAGLTPDVPPGLAEVVGKMMRKKPEERFQNPQEVAAALRPYTERSPVEREAVIAVGATGGDVRAPERGDLGSGDAPTSTTGGSDVGNEASQEFSIQVDLGPAPSLTGSVRNPRPWFGTAGPRPPSGCDSTSSGSDSGSAVSASRLDLPAGPGRPRWQKAAMLLGLLASGLAVEEGVRRSLGRGDAQVRRPTLSANVAKGASPGRVMPPIDWDKSPVAVLQPDGSMASAPDLLRAMETALGGKGIVVLRGGTPIELQAGEGHSISGRGTLQIQGVEGETTVLKIALDAAKPFLATGSGVNLVLKNLTIEVSRPAVPSVAASPAPAPPALIMAAGKALLEHCAIRTAPTHGYPGSCAIVSNGGGLSVTHCWFEGFETAVEIRALAGNDHILRQSMFVPGGTPSEAVKSGKPVRRGWAARIVFEGGGVPRGGRSVRFDHCTFVGEGLSQIVGFTGRSPLRLDAVGCAARVERLLGWSGSPSDASWTPKSLTWTGVDNQLDVAGDVWISTAEAAPTVSGADEWARIYSEKGLNRAAIQFTMAPLTPDGRLSPQAYSIVRATSPTPGADPYEVGPKP
ncbi:serine/threonine-protein kinase [Paludisphaera mucosa]|uniref:Serine/threonine-protein kinase n=1 Tax=Paludisphaera mucosa TaxID=3030827 RepID=A0ABT6F7Z3_9BACT|nr:serine/threonine-protein kinase [Paludisphaera mucosa]MDG3003520.1 serine/threonine-protein kinase [Paludisphaera mucosa]